jgi:hypothetical protein
MQRPLASHAFLRGYDPGFIEVLSTVLGFEVFYPSCPTDPARFIKTGACYLEQCRLKLSFEV